MINCDAIYEQSTPSSPIVFILSPGSDPTSDLMKLAERSGFGGNKFRFLAMGQGQEKVLKIFFPYLSHKVLKVVRLNVYKDHISRHANQH